MNEEDIKVRQAFLKAIAEVKAKHAEREKREYEAWLKHQAEEAQKRMEREKQANTTPDEKATTSKS